MAALTWYLTDASVSVGSDLSLSDPGAEAYRSPVTGWVVSTGSTNHSEWFNDVERAASTFTGTTVPDGSLDTTNGDFWVSPSALTGDFVSGNGNIHFACRANTSPTSAPAQDGRMRCRLFRGPNQDGSGATEITAAQQQGGLITDLLSGTTQVSTATFNPGAFSVNNEYIFVQIAWERTGAGPMTSSDVNARIGNASGTGSRVITADFTADDPSSASSASSVSSASSSSSSSASSVSSASSSSASSASSASSSSVSSASSQSSSSVSSASSSSLSSASSESSSSPSSASSSSVSSASSSSSSSPSSESSSSSSSVSSASSSSVSSVSSESSSSSSSISSSSVSSVSSSSSSSPSSESSSSSSSPSSASSSSISSISSVSSSSASSASSGSSQSGPSSSSVSSQSSSSSSSSSSSVSSASSASSGSSSSSSSLSSASSVSSPSSSSLSSASSSFSSSSSSSSSGVVVCGPVYENASTLEADGNLATSITGQLPAGLVNGNFLLAVCAIRNGDHHPVWSGNGWLELTHVHLGAGFIVALAACEVDGIEEAPTVSWATPAQSSIQVFQWSGVAAGYAAHIAVDFINHSTIGAGFGSTHTSPSHNTSGPCSRMVYVDTSADNVAVGTPSGWAENVDEGSDADDVRRAVGGKNLAIEGTASGVISIEGANNWWAQYQIELMSVDPDESSASSASSTSSSSSASSSSSSSSSTGVLDYPDIGVTTDPGFEYQATSQPVSPAPQPGTDDGGGYFGTIADP